MRAYLAAPRERLDYNHLTEPSIFEPLFADCSFGYRPGRSLHMAMRKVWREINDQKASNLSSELRRLQQLAHGTGIVEELSA